MPQLPMVSSPECFDTWSDKISNSMARLSLYQYKNRTDPSTYAAEYNVPISSDTLYKGGERGSRVEADRKNHKGSTSSSWDGILRVVRC